MRPNVLLLGIFLLSACLTKEDPKNPPTGDLWVYDSVKSSPKYPQGVLIFKFLEDTLHLLGKGQSTMWKVKTCYYPDRKIEFVRSGDTIVFVNTTDSIWSGPKVFYENSVGELQSDSADTSRFKFFFKRISSYPDCNELFSRNFQLILRRVSTENELYLNRRFDLELDYSLNGLGYGYSGYEIIIEGGPTILGSYIKWRGYYDSAAIANQGRISLTIPLDSLYDSLAENIRLEINLAGRVSDGREFFYGKEIIYQIGKMYNTPQSRFRHGADVARIKSIAKERFAPAR